MYEYLKSKWFVIAENKKNVVAVHCNHGKGRTGTTIICFLMFTGFFHKYDEALKFYNMRRFVSLTYGVSQPCQKRYLNYFEILRSR
jgi:protein-tyrosine phosphatase